MLVRGFKPLPYPIIKTSVQELVELHCILAKDFLRLAGNKRFFAYTLAVTSLFLQRNMNVLCTFPCTADYHEGYIFSNKD